MESEKGELLEIAIDDIEVDSSEDDYYQVKLVTNRGNIKFRYYQVSGAKRGAIWVGGVGGDWDTPAKGLYPRICQELKGEEIASLRVRFRHPTVLEEALLDVLTGISFLESDGIETVALTGHSFGGAVVIQAAAISSVVRTVVTLATQSYGAAPASELAPGCSIQLIHGKKDHVLPPFCSEYIYSIAQDPKNLILYEGADHGLDAVAEDVYQAVYSWIVEQLKEDVVTTPGEITL